MVGAFLTSGNDKISRLIDAILRHHLQILSLNFTQEKFEDK